MKPLLNKIYGLKKKLLKIEILSKQNNYTIMCKIKMYIITLYSIFFILYYERTI